MNPDDERMDKWRSGTFDHLATGLSKSLRAKEDRVIGGFGRWLTRSLTAWTRINEYTFRVDAGAVVKGTRRSWIALEGANDTHQLSVAFGEAPEAGKQAVILFAKHVKRRGRPLKQKQIDRARAHIIGYYETGGEPIRTRKTWAKLAGRPGFTFIAGSILFGAAALIHPAAIAVWLVPAIPVFGILHLGTRREKKRFEVEFQRVLAPLTAKPVDEDAVTGHS